MKNYFSQMIDVTDYITNSELEKVANVVSTLSDAAKQAYIPSYDEYDRKDVTDFAVVLWHSGLGELKKFACYNPELTEINMGVLVEQMGNLSPEITKTAAANLTAAAHKYNLEIPEGLKDYDSKKFINRIVDVTELIEIPLEKTAEARVETVHNKFALYGKYPIDTQIGIKKAAEWFDRNLNKLSVDEVLEFTANVTKEAGDQGVMLQGNITKFASLTDTTFNPDFYNHVSIRKSQLKDNEDEAKSLYNDLVKRADELGVEKVACVLEVIDREFGIDKLYGTHVVTPIEAVYGIQKVAGVSINGKLITQEMLKKASQEELCVIVGNDVVKELRSADGLQILESLPTPIKNEIASII